ncbi:MAG TPA: alpha/beta fold hydrolase [Polyangia bacterium]|nr:alpha/beta fold hydrolase [Polyangia bacterium]
MVSPPQGTSNQPPTSGGRTVDHDGATLHYELHGDAGDPLLCVMGLGGDLQFWERQTPVFARAHQTVVFDNRGAGRSSKPKGPYTIAQLADDAAAILDAAGLARVHVVGLSMGGMIAQELVLRHPDRVGALVLAATYARADAGIREVSAEGANKLGSPLGMLTSGAIDPAQLDIRQLFKFLMSLVLSPEFMAREKPWLRSLLDRILASEPSMDAFLGQVAAVLAHDSTARLTAVRAPTLVMTGDADRLVPPHHADELAALIPGARLLKVPGGTHGFNIEMPEAFNSPILAFLAEHPLASLR